jgi:hypothetical protein
MLRLSRSLSAHALVGREHRIINAHGEQNDALSQVFGTLMDTLEAGAT